ncbi:MAG: hypothetical protein A3K06_02725 [Candidatus Doudnabacteria bacterium RIFCSPHIGHO2_01_52_17]|uniref:Uncharacterized protein n=1 Tax=Candidatus Doudnabacteria bacterium RIFCSPHIGHO2_01_52_17 TaxID=1817820 RepID=A0A1F5NG18_9BACT|nr:MAG: hypothetical protein A3K06_02725 [Candidatus Doudnabacteria bacterium RIFCSPHIGHO2_01_52_17]
MRHDKEVVRLIVRLRGKLSPDSSAQVAQLLKSDVVNIRNRLSVLKRSIAAQSPDCFRKVVRRHAFVLTDEEVCFVRSIAPQGLPVGINRLLTFRDTVLSHANISRRLKGYLSGLNNDETRLAWLFLYRVQLRSDYNKDLVLYCSARVIFHEHAKQRPRPQDQRSVAAPRFSLDPPSQPTSVASATSGGASGPID